MVHAQYNTPIGLYSADNIAHTYSTQTAGIQKEMAKYENGSFQLIINAIPALPENNERNCICHYVDEGVMIADEFRLVLLVFYQYLVYSVINKFKDFMNANTNWWQNIPPGVCSPASVRKAKQPVSYTLNNHLQ